MRDSIGLRVPSCMLIILIAFWPAVNATGERSIGFVLEMAGGWTANGAPLRVGQAVPPGGKVEAVRTNARRASSRLALVLLDSKVIHLACTNDKPCDSYTLPTSLSESSTLIQRISAAAVNLFGQRPERYTPAITRSGTTQTSACCLETVLELNDGKLGIAPLMSGFPDGEYALSFRRTNEEEPGASGSPVAFEWQSNTEESLVTADRLVPGLYSVLIRALANSDESCRTDNAWALVVTGREDFERASADLAQVRDSVKSWQGVSEAGRRSFLRLSLEFLSTQLK